jgi:thioredoxin
MTTENDLDEFDGETFDEEVLAAEGLVLVDFWGEQCVSCKQLRKVLNQLANEIPPNVRIGAVNATANPDLAERYGVRGVPALLFFKSGEIVDMRTGVDRRQVLKKLVESHA